MSASADKSDQREIARNKKARHDYHIIEELEAGIELRGTEVKSIRQGHVQVRDAYARVEKGEIWLYGLDIPPYDKASHTQHAARRPRRLLLHRKEIDKLEGAVREAGRTLVALALYFKGQRVKVRLGVAKGKHHADRREDVKKRDAKREIEREIARARRH